MTKNEAPAAPAARTYAEILYPVHCGDCGRMLAPGMHPTNAHLEVICKGHLHD